MNTYLVTWNPANWTWTKLPEQAASTAKGTLVSEKWSCGKTRKIEKGDRLFLLKQGEELPKGIIASGTAASKVYGGKHWDREKAAQGATANFVEADWDVILDPEREPLLPVSAMNSFDLPSVNWKTQMSGISIPALAADFLEELWARHVGYVRQKGVPYSESGAETEEDGFPEGQALYRLHRTYERSPLLVEQAKSRVLRKNGRLVCQVCRFDFFQTYGPVGKHFIECHHVVPVSELGVGGKTKVNDIVLVCSNCHRMLHRRRPWLTVDSLKSLLSKHATT